jgi:hypothetical protein
MLTYNNLKKAAENAGRKNQKIVIFNRKYGKLIKLSEFAMEVIGDGRLDEYCVIHL